MGGCGGRGEGGAPAGEGQRGPEVALPSAGTSGQASPPPPPHAPSTVTARSPIRCTWWTGKWVPVKAGNVEGHSRQNWTESACLPRGRPGDSGAEGAGGRLETVPSGASSQRRLRDPGLCPRVPGSLTATASAKLLPLDGLPSPSCGRRAIVSPQRACGNSPCDCTQLMKDSAHVQRLQKCVITLLSQTLFRSPELAFSLKCLFLLRCALSV